MMKLLWGTGSAQKLAIGVKAAVDETAQTGTRQQ